MIKIGITWCGYEDRQANYHRWITGGATPVEVVLLQDGHASPDDALTCDGLILSGGVDIEPARHGKSPGYPHEPAAFDTGRDAFEHAIFNHALARGIPLLGICRGMQLINCLLGGSLHLDNGPDANRQHRGLQYDKVHGLDIAPGSLLHRMTGTGRTVANSAHHQSIDRLADALAFNATWEGMIEGVEWKDPAGKSFLMGVQWHPEAMHLFNLQELPASRQVREGFLAEVARAGKAR